MKKALATLYTIVALSAPVPAEAILGMGTCVEKLPVKVEVKRGDTLIGLAKTYYDGDSFRYRDIARHNGIKYPYKIRVGQILELPGETYERTRLVSTGDLSSGRYCNSSDY